MQCTKMIPPELPVELQSLILRFLADNRREPTNNGYMLNAALACKRFADIVIPQLYQNIVVQKEGPTLQRLATRLTEQPELGRTVYSFCVLDCDDGDDEWDDDWADSVQKCTLESSDDNEGRTIDFALEWPRVGCFKDSLVGLILLCCPNLREIELVENDNVDTSQPQVFMRDFWPWKDLKRVTIGRYPGLYPSAAHRDYDRHLH